MRQILLILVPTSVVLSVSHAESILFLLLIPTFIGDTHLCHPKLVECQNLIQFPGR